MLAIDIAFRRVEDFDQDRLNQSRQARGTYTISADTDILEMSKTVEQKKIQLILVVNDQYKIVGIILPAIVKSKIDNYRNQIFTTFFEALNNLEEDSNEHIKNFYYEWLHFERPELFWCIAGHYVDCLPCQDH